MATWEETGAVGFRVTGPLKEAAKAFIAAQAVPPRPSQLCKTALAHYLAAQGFPVHATECNDTPRKRSQTTD